MLENFKHLPVDLAKHFQHIIGNGNLYKSIPMNSLARIFLCNYTAHPTCVDFIKKKKKYRKAAQSNSIYPVNNKLIW